MTKLFLIIFLICSIANFVFSVLILRTLNRGGTKIGFYEIRWQVHKHLKTYKELSMKQTGKTGLPFYGYWCSLFGLVMFAGLLFLSLSRKP